jgi:hypothetical protein
MTTTMSCTITQLPSYSTSFTGSARIPRNQSRVTTDIRSATADEQQATRQRGTLSQPRQWLPLPTGLDRYLIILLPEHVSPHPLRGLISTRVRSKRIDVEAYKKKNSQVYYLCAAARSENSTPPVTCQPGQDGTTQFGIQQPRFAKRRY